MTGMIQQIQHIGKAQLLLEDQTQQEAIIEQFLMIFGQLQEVGRIQPRLFL